MVQAWLSAACAMEKVGYDIQREFAPSRRSLTLHLTVSL